MSLFWQTEIKYLPGVGPKKALLLQQELQVSTFEDLITYYPIRYIDRRRLHKVREVEADMPYVQLQGTIGRVKVGQVGKKRLLAYLKDDTGEMCLVWFKGLQWILPQIKPGVVYTVFGKLARYQQHLSLIHPELTAASAAYCHRLGIWPVYRTTEKLRKQHLDAAGLAKLQRNLLEKARPHMRESLPHWLLEHYELMSKPSALCQVHDPGSYALLQQARRRLKFEELFYLQLQLLQHRQIRVEKHIGQVFSDTKLLRRFYAQELPFELTSAQKRVIKEIYHDLRSGRQMNRLLQGDVGSGKTIVAFLSMLICIGSGAQVAMMAPTELLAAQHYHTLQALAQATNVTVALLTSSTKKKQRTEILTALQTGTLQMLVGTHALLNDAVAFHKLGLAVIDEQHRFGVSQRAKLWAKQRTYFPHVLVMTATPIPRTLAMTFYGDLDVSVIDGLPAGRKPIQTRHFYDTQRLKVFQFLRAQMLAAKQVYIVYPLIEASERLHYKNLMDGYESVCRAFPEFPISIVHGQMSAADKAYEMQRFVKGETKLLVATTVIEVGVNVPNATAIVIENAERFGLAQLHQLRGRVGRGSSQAYCILMTGTQLSSKSKERMKVMVHTNDGFKIADVDLKLRGPGDLLGLKQSGVLDLKIADLSQDNQLLQAARSSAQQLFKEDPTLMHPQNMHVKAALQRLHQATIKWSRVG